MFKDLNSFDIWCIYIFIWFSGCMFVIFIASELDKYVKLPSFSLFLTLGLSALIGIIVRVIFKLIKLLIAKQ